MLEFGQSTVKMKESLQLDGKNKERSWLGCNDGAV